MELLKILGEHVLSLAGNYYVFAAAVLMIHCLFDPGVLWERKNRRLLFLIVLLDEIINTVWENQPLGEVFLFVCYFLAFAGGCREKPIRRSLKVLGAAFYLIFCLVMVEGMGEYNFFHTLYEGENGFLWGTVICAALYYYLLETLYKKDIVILFGKREKWLLAFYGMYLFTIYGMIDISLEEDPWMGEIIRTVMGVGTLIFSLGLPVYIFKARAGAYYRDMKDYQEEYLQAQLSYFQQYKENQEETRRFRHDLNNHLLCLSEMMQEGKREEAESYVNSLIKQEKALSPEVVTGDEMLDCMISSKLGRMGKEGISFHLEGILEGGLGLSPMDTCCIFANAMDNAIEACKKIPEGGRREIDITLKKTEQFFCIEIGNTVSENQDMEKLLSSQGNFTSKKNRNLHGYGIYNMRRTVEKYGGIFRMECREKWVTVSIVLNRTSPV